MARFTGGRIYPGYLFKTHDPIRDAMMTLAEQAGYSSNVSIAAETGLSESTVANIRKGKTRLPRSSTVGAWVYGLGGEFLIRYGNSTIAVKSERGVKMTAASRKRLDKIKLRFSNSEKKNGTK